MGVEISGRKAYFNYHGDGFMVSILALEYRAFKRLSTHFLRGMKNAGDSITNDLIMAISFYDFMTQGLGEEEEKALRNSLLRAFTIYTLKSPGGISGGADDFDKHLTDESERDRVLNMLSYFTFACHKLGHGKPISHDKLLERDEERLTDPLMSLSTSSEMITLFKSIYLKDTKETSGKQSSTKS